MRIALIVVAGTLDIGIPEIGAAQAPGPSVLWQRPVITAPASSIAASIGAVRAPDHRWEGMAVGAAAGALAFGLLGAIVCGQSDSTDDCTGIMVGSGLLGAFAGGITGGLIGGAIPKEVAADSASKSN